MQCQKFVSAIAIVLYKRVRYIGMFLWDFDHESAGSAKKCPLLQGVRCIASTL